MRRKGRRLPQLPKHPGGNAGTMLVVSNELVPVNGTYRAPVRPHLKRSSRKNGKRRIGTNGPAATVAGESL